MRLRFAPLSMVALASLASRARFAVRTRYRLLACQHCFVRYRQELIIPAQWASKIPDHWLNRSQSLAIAKTLCCLSQPNIDLDREQDSEALPRLCEANCEANNLNELDHDNINHSYNVYMCAKSETPESVTPDYYVWLEAVPLSNPAMDE